MVKKSAHRARNTERRWRNAHPDTLLGRGVQDRWHLFTKKGVWHLFLGPVFSVAGHGRENLLDSVPAQLLDLEHKFYSVSISYREWRRDWPDEARQPVGGGGHRPGA